MDETIGGRLRAAREQRQLTLQQASDITKVRTHYLQALENDDLSVMPSAAQARGFLRIYSDFLGLQVPDVLPAESAVTPAPYVDLTPAPKPAAEAASRIPGTGVLDALRGLRARFGKRETNVENPQSEVGFQPNGDGSLVGPSSEVSPGTAKKKVNP